MKIETLYNEWKSLQPLREEDANRLRQKIVLELKRTSTSDSSTTIISLTAS